MILGVTLTSTIASRTPYLLMACGVVMSLTSFGMVSSETVGLQFLFGIVNGMCMCFIPAMLTMIYRLPASEKGSGRSRACILQLPVTGSPGSDDHRLIETSRLAYGPFVAAFAPSP